MVWVTGNVLEGNVQRKCPTLIARHSIVNTSVYPAIGRPGSWITQLNSGAQKRLIRSPIEGYGPRPQATAQLARAEVGPQAIAQASARGPWGLSRNRHFAPFSQFLHVSVTVAYLSIPNSKSSVVCSPSYCPPTPVPPNTAQYKATTQRTVEFNIELYIRRFNAQKLAITFISVSGTRTRSPIPVLTGLSVG